MQQQPQRTKKRTWSEDGVWDTSITDAPDAATRGTTPGPARGTTPGPARARRPRSQPAETEPAEASAPQPEALSAAEPGVEPRSTTIGPSLVVRGKLRSGEDLVVHGRIEAAITSTGDLRLERTGVIVADIDVRSARIGGVVVGNIRASERIELDPGARVVGDLKTPRLFVADGAQLNGNVDMEGLEALEADVAKKPAGAGQGQGYDPEAPTRPNKAASPAPSTSPASRTGPADPRSEARDLRQTDPGATSAPAKRGWFPFG